MKKFLSLLLVAVLCCALFAGCGNSAKEEPATNEAPAAAATEDAMKVIYLVNGSLGDKGFFDSAASGINKMASDLGAQTKIVEMGRDETSYESNYLDVSDQDYDLIVSGTFSVKERAARTGKNPATGETIEIADEAFLAIGR